MKFLRSDYRKIQASLWVALLMIAIGAAALYYSHSARTRAELARDLVMAQRQESDGKLKQVRDEEIEIKQKSILFTRLQERGIIGPEQRLEWVELLKEIRDKRRLIDLQYEIAPQRLLDGNPTGSYAFHSSAMKLQLRLLHEEDLTRLIGDLRSQAKALIRVRSCDVARLPASADERSGRRANLSAECEIDWLTLREVSRK
jgi:hypothetical protein